MQVVINQDEKTAADHNGLNYEINGVLVRKQPPASAQFYGLETSFCKNILHKGHTSNAFELENGTINLL